jgi:hypothetical protein
MIHQVVSGPEIPKHPRKVQQKGGEAMTNGHGLRAHLPKGTYTRPMLAEKVGRTLRWIRQLEDDGHIHWSRTKRFGNIEVKLYTEADVRKVQQFLANQHHGRPRKEVAAAKRSQKVVKATLSDRSHRVSPAKQSRKRRKQS